MELDFFNGDANGLARSGSNAKGDEASKAVVALVDDDEGESKIFRKRIGPVGKGVIVYDAAT